MRSLLQPTHTTRIGFWRSFSNPESYQGSKRSFTFSWPRIVCEVILVTLRIISPWHNPIPSTTPNMDIHRILTNMTVTVPWQCLWASTNKPQFWIQIIMYYEHLKWIRLPRDNHDKGTLQTAPERKWIRSWMKYRWPILLSSHMSKYMYVHNQASWSTLHVKTTVAGAANNIVLYWNYSSVCLLIRSHVWTNML